MIDVDTLEKFNPWWTKKTVPKQFLGSSHRPVFQTVTKYLEKRFILLLFGLRRVGKTTLMYQTIQHLLEAGNHPLTLFYFSFDEGVESIDRLIAVYEEKILKKKISDGGNITLFFDEVQKAPLWQEKIKILYDLHPNCKIFLSGSASVFLEQHSKESLAGRVVDIFVEPLRFDEFIQWKKIECDVKLPEIYHSVMMPALMDYLRKGGFPEIVDEQDDDIIRTYVKNTVLERIVFRDLPEEFGLKDVDLLRVLVEMFAKDPGMIVNVDRLARDLGRSKVTVLNYLSYLRYALIAREVKNLRSGFLVSSRKNKKIYPSNTAFCFAYRDDFYTDRLLQKVAEVAVAQALSAEYYFRNSVEVDFIHKTSHAILPIEVKFGENIEQKQMMTVMKKHGLKKGIIVSKNARKTQNGIDVIPLWLFLMNSEEYAVGRLRRGIEPQ